MQRLNDSEKSWFFLMKKVSSSKMHRMLEIMTSRISKSPGLLAGKILFALQMRRLKRRSEKLPQKASMRAS